MFKNITLVFSFLLVFILFFSLNSYASTYDLPPLPEVNSNNYHYVIFNSSDTGQVNDSKWRLQIFVPNDDTGDFILSSFRTTSGINNFTHNSIKQFKSYYYTLENGNWKLFNTYNSTNKGGYYSYEGSAYHIIAYSTTDIYQADKTTLFFQKTPMPSMTVPTLEEKLAEEIPATANKIIQTMKIILLCGVGCLAFLACLVILPKVLYRFL